MFSLLLLFNFPASSRHRPAAIFQAIPRIPTQILSCFFRKFRKVADVSLLKSFCGLEGCTHFGCAFFAVLISLSSHSCVISWLFTLFVANFKIVMPGRYFGNGCMCIALIKIIDLYVSYTIITGISIVED